MILVSVKSSIEKWNKKSVFCVHVVWFGIIGKVNPRYIGLFSLIVVSLRSSRVPYAVYTIFGLFWC